jgi:hypothetical protein
MWTKFVNMRRIWSLSRQTWSLLQAPKAPGLAIPQAVLARAEEVIE